MQSHNDEGCNGEAGNPAKPGVETVVLLGVRPRQPCLSSPFIAPPPRLSNYVRLKVRCRGFTGRLDLKNRDQAEPNKRRSDQACDPAEPDIERVGLFTQRPGRPVSPLLRHPIPPSSADILLLCGPILSLLVCCWRRRGRSLFLRHFTNGCLKAPDPHSVFWMHQQLVWPDVQQL